MRQIPRIHAPDQATFDDFAARQEPVVITGAMDDWKAVSRWTPEYLKGVRPDRKIRAATIPEGGFDGHVEAHRVFEEFEFPDFIAAIEDPSRVGGRIYNLHTDLDGALAALKPDTSVPRFFPRESLYSGLLLAGPPGYLIRAHYDVPNNLLVQLSGEKHILLFPPSELYRMYPHPGYTASAAFSQVDIENPDRQKHPRFRRDRAVETILGPGEMIFIPSCWWHQIRYRTMTVGMNFFFKLPLAQMFRLNVVRCAGMLLHRPDLTALVGRKKKAA